MLFVNNAWPDSFKYARNNLGILRLLPNYITNIHEAAVSQSTVHSMLFPLDRRCCCHLSCFCCRVCVYLFARWQAGRLMISCLALPELIDLWCVCVCCVCMRACVCVCRWVLRTLSPTGTEYKRFLFCLDKTDTDVVM